MEQRDSFHLPRKNSRLSSSLQSREIRARVVLPHFGRSAWGPAPVFAGPAPTPSALMTTLCRCSFSCFISAGHGSHFTQPRWNPLCLVLVPFIIESWSPAEHRDVFGFCCLILFLSSFPLLEVIYNSIYFFWHCPVIPITLTPTYILYCLFRRRPTTIP